VVRDSAPGVTFDQIQAASGAKLHTN